MLHIVIIEQKPIEIFQRCDCPGNRSNGLAVAAHPVDIFTQLFLFRRAEVGVRVCMQVFAELADIPQV